MTLTVGLIVNPIAGMGGSVGLKGTDGGMHEKAVELGALPVSPDRTRTFLAHVCAATDLHWLAAPGNMGSDYLEALGQRADIIGSVAGESRAADTQAIAQEMLAANTDLLVFAGGDGTARDVADAIDAKLPVVAIPAGVKVYSSVFAYSPQAAAELVAAFAGGADVSEAEVLDIDEDAFRAGRVDARHYGFLLVPVVEELVQGGKESSAGAESAEAKRKLGSTVAGSMEPGTLYLLGTGTTVRAVADALGIGKTLLGVDAVLDGQLIASDLAEKQILELLERYPQTRIVVTPLGGNGFIFGRGNKQFTPAVLRRVGRDNIIVLANREKLLKLGSLHVDTGDEDLDAEMAGYIDVIVGQSHRKLMRVE